MDDFTLAPPAPAPLDLSSFTQTATPPFASPRQPQQQGPDEKRQLLKLSLMLPLAMKAGPGAVQGLLQGFAQHDAQQKAMQRQGQLDQRQLDQDAQQRQYQQGQITNQQQQNQRALLNDFATKIGTLDDPAAIDALTNLYTAQASQLGLKPEALTAYAQQYRNPSRIQKRAAEKKIAQLKSEYGADKWMEMGAQFTHQLPGSDQPVTFDQLLALAGQARDPQAPTQTPKGDTRSLDVQAADALARGDTETYTRLLKVKREMGQADDRPRDPVQAALAAALLQQRQQQLASLPPKVQTRVDAKSRAFEQNQTVKNTQTMAEAAAFAKSLNPTTTNPTDDQALIYAFAKVMDPNSVVREGEYATVKAYAQTWAQTFGFDVQRLFSNVAFLTPQARANMKRTILAKFNATKGQYDNLRKSYAKQINQITGDTNGEDYLTDYGGAFPSDETPAQPTPARVVPPARAGGAGPLAAPGANPFRRGQ